MWTDRARATALTQSSLLVDPPDGKLPALFATLPRLSYTVEPVPDERSKNSLELAWRMCDRSSRRPVWI